MAKEIQLTQGKVALVSDEDYERVSQYKWHAGRNSRGYWYAQRRKKGHTVLLHRFILNAPAGVMVDHRDGDGLNNTRGNLRFCTNTQNQSNSRRPAHNKSGYKGVHFNKKDGKWYAQIRVSGKVTYLHSFDTAELAAREYDRAARKYFGEFARTNFED
jgi:hypothetical protein